MTLLPITPEILKSLLASDDLTNDFINNSVYSTSTLVPVSRQTATDRTNINIINVAKVLLSYYMSMNKVKDMLSQYSSILKNKGNISPENKDDMELRVKLLNYVVSQKDILENYDNVHNELEQKNKELAEKNATIAYLTNQRSSLKLSGKRSKSRKLKRYIRSLKKYIRKLERYSKKRSSRH